ncbi:MAG: DUF4038 domain-containing protein [bacterium]|nr:DUF4038 domain-containing protein [bacterium]
MINLVKIKKEKWSAVLEYCVKQTKRPFLLHPVPNETSHEVVNNNSLLATETVQTGQDYESRKLFWQYPQTIFTNNPHSTYINLEPWYEGIRDSFFVKDQLYAYWVTMLSGAHSYCYGAQGVWNVGDGHFLSHWGKQTLEQAMQLNTPKLIGDNHKSFVSFGGLDLNQVEIRTDQGQLAKIKKFNNQGKQIIYYPDYKNHHDIEKGKYYLPLENKFLNTPPQSGQLVIFQDLKMA